MIADFAARLLAWYDRHGRHDLPWQHPRSAYRVWLAEVMLQQTQVATVIPYYLRFLQAFPDLPSLAAASQDAVLAQWSGLGYYSRARNLHAAAQRCVEQHGGELPRDIEAIQALPGIGRSTAAAISAQAFDAAHPILDGNVKRVLCRVAGIEGWPGASRVEAELWSLAASLMPSERCADYTQAIMDFGATLCTRSRPACGLCPFRSDCVALATLRIDQLPAARPRKPIPQRECEIAVLFDGEQRVLLQRRPGSGVWGGLWSLPQFDSSEARLDFAAALGEVDGWQALDLIDHSFTHFQLRLRPYRAVLLAARLRVADSDDLRWVAAEQRGALGQPTPVRRLLDRLFGAAPA